MCEVFLISLFPPTNNEFDNFNFIDCNPSGPEVNIVYDDELSGKSVIDIVGEESKITFNCNSTYESLVMQINSGNRFFSIEIRIRDESGKERTFQLSNKKSSIMLINDTCTIPMDIGDGWQRICISLDSLLSRAFGFKFVSCSSVTIFGSCRLAKIYFQDEDYADPQLPLFLRVADQKAAS
jgi:Protein of unknown function (DUF667)